MEVRDCHKLCFSLEFSGQKENFVPFLYLDKSRQQKAQTKEQKSPK